MKPYFYIEQPGDTLSVLHVEDSNVHVRPVIWAQNGRYGWISKEQVQNMARRSDDLEKQQKGYARDKPIKLYFHWGDVVELDPITVKLMRAVSP